MSNAVESEYGGGSALSVDRELLGKVSGAVGVGHGSGGQQQQLAEVAGVEGKTRNLSAGKTLAAAGLRRSFLAAWQDADFRCLGRQLQQAGEGGAVLNHDGFCQVPSLAGTFHRKVVVSGHQVREGEVAAGRSRSLIVAISSGQSKSDGRRADCFSQIVAHNAAPGRQGKSTGG